MQVIDSDEDSGTPWICFDRNDWYGTQDYTCTTCLNHICYDGDCLDTHGRSSKNNWCTKCEKGFVGDVLYRTDVIVVKNKHAIIVKQ